MPIPDFSLLKRKHVSPRNEIEERLVAIWQQVLEIEKISIHDDFFHLGGHSLLAITLRSQIEKQMNVNFTLKTLFEFPTIKELASSVEQQNSSEKSIFTQMNYKQNTTPILCFSGMGATVKYFQKFAQALSRSCYVTSSIDAPLRIPVHSSLIEMATEYTKLILEETSRQDYILCGHSMGGIIAFEVAKKLQQQGKKIALLAMIDTPSSYKQSVLNESQISKIAVSHFANFNCENLNIDSKNFEKLTWEEKIKVLYDKLLQQKKLRHKIVYKALKHYADIYRSQINFSYQPANEIAYFPTILFTSENNKKSIKAPSLGWREYIKNIETSPAIGNHIDMVEVYGYEIANKIEKKLQKIR